MGSVLGKTSSLSSRIPHSSLDTNFKWMGYFRWGGQHGKDQEVRQKQVRFQRCKFSPSGLEHNVCVFALCVCVCARVCPSLGLRFLIPVMVLASQGCRKDDRPLDSVLGLSTCWLQSRPNKYCVRAQSHPALRDPTDCSPSGSPVHGISQARILKWVAISFSRGSSPPRD